MPKGSKSGTILGLFSGIGGIELGFQQEGFNVAAVCERNFFCQQILGKHFPKADLYGDIRDLDGTFYWGSVDVVVGGSPCQDFSKSNNKKEGIHGERSGLWSEMFRIIKEVEPRYVLWENVSNAVNRGFGTVVHDLAQAGYISEWRVINAFQVGLQHRRPRLYLVAYSRDQQREGSTKEPLLRQSDLQEQSARVPPRWGERSDIPQPRAVGTAHGFSNVIQRVAALGNSVPVPIIRAHAAAIKRHMKQ